MGISVDLRVLELLSARLCHELISPIGAIANGVELLGEDDPEFVRDATALIGQSAKRAGQRLQFYRFAYGSLTTSGSPASGGPDPRELVAGLLDGGKTVCQWRPETAALAPEWRKLACNIVVLAAEMLPRGGEVRVAGGGEPPTLQVTASGETVNLPAEARAAIEMRPSVAELTSRTVQGYFTACLAKSLGLRLAVAEEAPGRILLTATP